MKIALDTNTLINFYRNGKDKLQTLDDLVGMGTQVVFPEQVHREFLRNRESTIDDYLKTYKPPAFPVLPGFIVDLTEYLTAKRALDEHIASWKQVVQIIQQRRTDPSTDPVVVLVDKLYIVAQQIETTDQLLQMAHRRAMRGDPPRSTDKKSIGDEIIWEALLADVRDDLVLISSDGDFTKSSAFLEREFRQRTGYTLTIEQEMPGALAKLNRSAAVIDRAKKAVEEQQATPPPFRSGSLGQMVSTATGTVIPYPSTVDDPRRRTLAALELYGTGTSQYRLESVEGVRGPEWPPDKKE